jgi:hypothetical protein
MRRLRPSVSDLPAATGTGRGLAQAEEGQCVYRPYSPSMRDKSSATYTQVHTMPHSPHAVSVHSPSVRHWAASQRLLLCRSGAGRPPCAAACACPYRCLCRSRCSHVGMLCVCVVDDGRRGVGAQQEEEEEHRNRGGTESETRQAQKSIIYKLSNHLNAAALPFIFWLLFSVRRGVLVARRRSPLTSLSLPFTPLATGSWRGGRKHSTGRKKNDSRKYAVYGSTGVWLRRLPQRARMQHPAATDAPDFQRTAGRADEHAPDTGCAWMSASGERAD